MVTVVSFLAEYPEFIPVDPAIILAKITAAVTEVDIRLFADETDHCVMLRTAHKLATLPFGQQNRLTAKDGSSVYQAEWERLARNHAGGPWVQSQTP